MAGRSAREQLERQKKIKEDAEERIKVLTQKVKKQNENEKKRIEKKIGEKTAELLNRKVTEQDIEVHIAILRELEEQGHYYTERMNNPEKYGLLPMEEEKTDSEQSEEQIEGQVADDSEQIEMQMEGQTANNSEEMPF